MNSNVTQYMTDSRGRLVPRENVAAVDQLRDELVKSIVDRAKELQQLMIQFRLDCEKMIDDFVSLAAQEYGAKHGGQKGNISLSSFDGRLCVKVSVSERVRFDERIQAAKALIDECIHEWTEGSRSEVRALVDHAFQVDKEGQISIGRILSLTRLAIEDSKWQEAMRAIRDSMQVVDSATYMRVYERHTPDGPWVAIPLDLAKL